MNKSLGGCGVGDAVALLGGEALLLRGGVSGGGLVVGGGVLGDGLVVGGGVVMVVVGRLVVGGGEVIVVEGGLLLPAPTGVSSLAGLS